ncbi:DUF2066 domain-containing protein [Shewanella sp. Choline-02u-19]|uniref:DUF2066 domain-containing protein n=1 Tax=unclassified Shewanella TaxID=196818 RepID=UPI000C34CFBE|nr:MULTISPECIES: DUF2066 domain-containing protein [unclassified Shewanella]PKH56868.1 DUF2066 domain-containing protein [Shewanella sp. Bg11-22]PKI27665.1 DUF2066 domain-containing protein [Shewanella sp. Choline-02u-19]
MLRSICRYLMIFALFASIPPLVTAAEVSKLDESLVAVESRANNLRSQAIKQAFKEVVLKNTGTRSALSHPDVVKQLASASSLMTQYGYQELDGELFIQVNFDHKRLISLLRQAGLPVWGRQRPLTLVWLVEDVEDDKSILSDASSSTTRDAFNTQSANRGVPLVFPLMDLDDAMQVGVNDIRGQFTDNVANASLRYQSNYFIMATIEPQGAVLRYQMALYPRERADDASQLTPLISANGEVSTVEQAVTAITAAASEYYVGQYAIADSGEKLTAKVAFTDVSQMKQLVEIEKYLNQLSAIKTVSVARIEGMTVEFNVALFGNEDDLHRLMKLDPRIEVISSITADEVEYASFETMTKVEKQTQIYYWKGQ